MNDYNGFSAARRNEAAAWLRAQWRTGALPKPAKCEACGQDQVAVDGHAEDYSKPFGPHIQAFHLCFICHLMLHCRHGNGAPAWERYRGLVRLGWRHRPVQGRPFGLIKRMLAGDFSLMEQVQTPRAATRLDEIGAAPDLNLVVQLPSSQRAQGELF